MPPRPTSLDRRWERTRKALIAGGREVIAERGVGEATVAAIVGKAGVSQPSFYNHFESKDELLEAIVYDFFERAGVQKRAVLSTIDDPAEALAINARQALRVASTDPVVAWVFLRAGPLRDLMKPPGQDPLTGAIAKGIASGRFSATDARTATSMIRGAAFPVLRDLLEGNASPDTDIHFAALVLRMLGLSPEEAEAIARRSLSDDPSPELAETSGERDTTSR